MAAPYPLPRSGRCVVTGGGPGAMEAANLGAASSTMGRAAVDVLIDRLCAVGHLDDDGARRVGWDLLADVASIDQAVANLA